MQRLELELAEARQQLEHLSTALSDVKGKCCELAAAKEELAALRAQVHADQQASAAKATETRDSFSHLQVIVPMLASANSHETHLSSEDFIYQSCSESALCEYSTPAR